MSRSVRLYSPQAEAVWQAMEIQGSAYSKRAFVERKYGESAKIFLTAYDFFVREFRKRVSPPEGAEYPYWAYLSERDLDAAAGGRVLRLSVPPEECVFFDMFDWQRILQMNYLGCSAEENAAFAMDLEHRGVRDASDVMLTGFYPDLRQKVLKSWERLFRFDEAIKRSIENDTIREPHFGLPADGSPRTVEAALWRLQMDWRD